jgi:DNA-binding protein YbaB
VSISDFGGADVERLLGETRRALGALRSANGTASPDGTAAPDGPHGGLGPTEAAPAEPVRGAGSAADGKITAKVAAGGHLDELTVDPRLLRSGADELCAQIMVAVNAAVDDLRAQTAQAAPATMDPAELAGIIEDLQAESVRQMNQITQGVAETVSKINAAAAGGHRG